MPVTVTHVFDEALPTGVQAATSVGSFTAVGGRFYIATINEDPTNSPSNNPPTMSGGGVTWSQLDSVPIGNSNRRVTCFYCSPLTPGAGGPLTVTTSGSGGFLRNAWLSIEEFQSVNMSAPVVRNNHSNDTGTAVTSGTVTLANWGDANDAGFAVFHNNQGASINPESGWTQLYQQSPAANDAICIAYRIGQDLSVTFTWPTQAARWCGIVAEIAFAAVTSVSATDSGSGSDSSVGASAKTVTDTGAGSETSSLVTSNSLSASDGGSGSDISTLVFRPALVDSGAGSEISSSSVTPFSVSDSGTGSEVSSFKFSAADSGAGSDTSSFSVAPFSRVESGTGSEISTLKSVASAADSSTGIEASTFTAGFPVTESGTDTEIATLVVIGISASDVGSSTETRILNTGSFVTANDVGVGDESIALSAVLPLVTDSGASVDAADPPLSQIVSDAGTGSDISSSVSKSSIDAGTESEISSFSVVLSVADTGTGSEITSAISKVAADAGTDSEVSSYSASFVVSDSSIGSETSALASVGAVTDFGFLASDTSFKVVFISIVEVGAGDETSLIDVTKISIFSTDTGSGTDSVVPHTNYILDEFGFGTDEAQFFGDFFIKPSARYALIAVGKPDQTKLEAVR